MGDQITIKSSTEGFTISPTVVGAADGKVTAIRVQDITKQKWFNWDNGVWDEVGEPVITPGTNNLYIAFWVVNQGNTGNLTLNVKDDKGLLATKTYSVPAGTGLGVEWTGDMPNGNYAITVESEPGNTEELMIKLTGGLLGGGLFGLPWWKIGLIALVIVGVGTTGYYISRKKKKE